MRIADFKGETRCDHAPTMLNYWHFTIDLYAPNDNENPLKKSAKGGVRKWPPTYRITSVAPLSTLPMRLRCQDLNTSISARNSR